LKRRRKSYSVIPNTSTRSSASRSGRGCNAAILADGKAHYTFNGALATTPFSIPQDGQPHTFDVFVIGGGVAIDAGSHWIRPLRMLLGEVEEVIGALGRPYAAMQGESLLPLLPSARDISSTMRPRDIGLADVREAMTFHPAMIVAPLTVTFEKLFRLFVIADPLTDDPFVSKKVTVPPLAPLLNAVTMELLLTFSLLQARYPASMLLRLVHEVIERRIVARTDEPTITDCGRRLIYDSAREQRHDLVLTAAVGAESTQQRYLAALQCRAHCRQPCQGST
jgi:hypothetical protein